MATTIFYSWQSDRPSKTNRSFIRSALDQAIKRVATEFDVEDALRIDQDTQGVPGNPPIAETILRKIDACDIFVPDLTSVAKTEDDDLVPNPNVLIELGYAMKSKVDGQFIYVMNEAFGTAENGLPFDLQHKRWPICYTLPEDASSDTRQETKSQLTKAFTDAIRTILESGVLQSEPEQPTFQEMSPVWKSSSYLQDGDILVGQPPHGESDIIWHNGPQVFLRLIPTKPTEERTPNALRNLAQENHLIPFGGDLGAYWGRNKYGAVVFGSRNIGPQIDVLYVTQVFKNGEIWGLNNVLSRKEPEGRRSIPSTGIEDYFEGALKSYIRFAQHSLGLSVPLRLIAGLSDVEDFTMALPPNYWGEKFSGRVVEEEIVYEGIINDYAVTVHELLFPFFQQVWDACGLERPEWFRK